MDSVMVEAIGSPVPEQRSREGPQQDGPERAGPSSTESGTHAFAGVAASDSIHETPNGSVTDP